MILIVDDHHDTGAPLARLLKGCGYDAVAVSSGKAALSLLPNARPSLVILDKPHARTERPRRAADDPV